MRKNIDLSDEAVKALSIQAIEYGTNFKNYVEAKLEEMARVKPDPKSKGKVKVEVNQLGDNA